MALKPVPNFFKPVHLKAPQNAGVSGVCQIIFGGPEICAIAEVLVAYVPPHSLRYANRKARERRLKRYRECLRRLECRQAWPEGCRCRSTAPVAGILHAAVSKIQVHSLQEIEANA